MGVIGGLLGDYKNRIRKMTGSTGHSCWRPGANTTQSASVGSLATYLAGGAVLGIARRQGPKQSRPQSMSVRLSLTSLAEKCEYSGLAFRCARSPKGPSDRRYKLGYLSCDIVLEHLNCYWFLLLIVVFCGD